MTRVLFVDDEPMVLNGLRSALRKCRGRWQMEFALGAEKALETLRSTGTDVIVSDMRMPGMDGATLLGHVKNELPASVRLVLTGHAEREAMFRAFGVAHRVLSKPCDGATLTRAIDRACLLQQTLKEERFQKLEALADIVEATPKVYWALTAELAKPVVDLDAAAAAINAEPDLAGTLMELATSPLFGVPSHASLPTVIGTLGLDVVQSLALCAHVMTRLKVSRTLIAHTLETAKLAKCVGATGATGHECFTAGMVHDFGRHVLDALDPSAEKGLSQDAELERFGLSHTDAGAWLLNRWGLPNPIVDAALSHHAPWQLNQTEFDTAACVYVADALVRQQESGEPHGLDLAWLGKLGAADSVPDWEAALARVGSEP